MITRQLLRLIHKANFLIKFEIEKNNKNIQDSRIEPQSFWTFFLQIKNDFLFFGFQACLDLSPKFKLSTYKF